MNTALLALNGLRGSVESPALPLSFESQSRSRHGSLLGSTNTALNALIKLASLCQTQIRVLSGEPLLPSRLLAFGQSGGRLSKPVGQGCWPQIDRFKVADNFPLILFVMNKQLLKAVAARKAEKLGLLGLIQILFEHLA